VEENCEAVAGIALVEIGFSTHMKAANLGLPVG